MSFRNETCLGGPGLVEVAWLRDGQPVEVRRFRAHLGHFVEVTGPGQRLWRVGSGLRHCSCSLKIDAPLNIVVRRALEGSSGVDLTPAGASVAMSVCLINSLLVRPRL